MSDSKGRENEIRSSAMNVEFELNAEQRKELIKCVEKTGKVSLKFKKVGSAELSSGLLGGISDLVIID